MKNNNQNGNGKQGEPIGSKQGTSKLTRANFGPGMLLQHEDLQLLNTYTRDLSRLLFRSFFGCGVVCGLQVSAAGECGGLKVTVSPGLALDCAGTPVHVPDLVTFPINKKCEELDADDVLWVVLCSATKHCAPRNSMCASDDDNATSVCTRERDMFELHVLLNRPPCACGCKGRDDTNGSGAYDTPTVAAVDAKGQLTGATDCWCVDPNTADCYKAHYTGECGCTCGDGKDCDCDCILLARLSLKDSPDGREKVWQTDHSVRRFIRPVLMRDWQVEEDRIRKPKQRNEKEKLPPQEPQPKGDIYYSLASDPTIEEIRKTHQTLTKDLEEVKAMIAAMSQQGGGAGRGKGRQQPPKGVTDIVPEDS